MIAGEPALSRSVSSGLPATSESRAVSAVEELIEDSKVGVKPNSTAAAAMLDLTLSGNAFRMQFVTGSFAKLGYCFSNQCCSDGVQSSRIAASVRLFAR